MKLEFSHQNFENKSSDIKLHQNPSSGSRVPCGQTDGHDEVNSRFSQYYERAYKLLKRNNDFIVTQLHVSQMFTLIIYNSGHVK